MLTLIAEIKKNDNTFNPPWSLPNTFKVVKQQEHFHRQWSGSNISSQGICKEFFSCYLGNCYLGTLVDKLHHIIHLAFVCSYEKAFWKHSDRILLAHELGEKGFQGKQWASSFSPKQKLQISPSSVHRCQRGTPGHWTVNLLLCHFLDLWIRKQNHYQEPFSS